MVGSMALDRGVPPRVAWLALLVANGAACRPVFNPDSTATPEPVINTLRTPHPAAAAGRHVVVGEMCPQAAAGRAAVAPLLMRGLSWTDTAAEVSNTIERGSVPRFVVFGVDGKMAGVFDTVGAVDLGLPQQAAAGTYTGARHRATYSIQVRARSRHRERITTRGRGTEVRRFGDRRLRASRSARSRIPTSLRRARAGVVDRGCVRGRRSARRRYRW